MQRYACIFFAEPMLAAQLSALAHSREREYLFESPRMLIRACLNAGSMSLEPFATFATFATCHIKHLP